MMEKEGKYIYCIIGTKQERNFGPIGIGGRGDEVLTIGYDDLSMVVSNYPVSRLVVNREGMLAHEKVIEEVMKEFDSVLPVRFGTVACNADEVRSFLDRRRREFEIFLKNMDHKVELGVKGIWRNMNIVFGEIEKENKKIRSLKKIIQRSGNENMRDRVTIGREVFTALQKKKAEDTDKIVEALRRSSFDFKLNNTVSDEMFMNVAFLVDKGREKEFDNIMDDLNDKYEERMKFLYAGPLPVFNFVNIVIYPEEWEQ